MTEREPRSLEDLPVSFVLHDKLDPGNLSAGSARLATITPKIGPSARVTKRGRGGWWALTATWEGEEWEKREFFLDGLQYEIRMNRGGKTLWAGFVAIMKLTLPSGEIYIRDWTRLYNKIKTIYTRLGDNELTNGSAESGAWTAYGTPTTNEHSTTWVSDGIYSNHIVANSPGDGATIQGGITIPEAKSKQGKINVNIVSGKWVFEIYREDTGEALTKRVEDNTGESELLVSISEDNTYSGNVGVRIYLHADSSSGEIYGDGAVFQDAPYKAETRWYSDTASQAIHGIKEFANLMGGSSDQAARNTTLTDLRKKAWPHTFPPNDYENNIFSNECRLEITAFGYVATLNSLHSDTTGTDAISDHLTALLSQAEFIEARVITENTTEFMIDTQGPLRIWDLIEDMTLAGDASGNRYECGVGESRKFDYMPVDDEPKYKQRGGLIFALDGSEIEPWEIEPGYILLEDMPLGPGQISGYETDDPRVVYMFETTFDAGDWLAGGPGLKWRGDSDE